MPASRDPMLAALDEIVEAAQKARSSHVKAETPEQTRGVYVHLDSTLVFGEDERTDLPLPTLRNILENAAEMAWGMSLHAGEINTSEMGRVEKWRVRSIKRTSITIRDSLDQVARLLAGEDLDEKSYEDGDELEEDMYLWQSDELLAEIVKWARMGINGGDIDKKVSYFRIITELCAFGEIVPTSQELSPHHPASGMLSDEEFEESGYDGPMVDRREVAMPAWQEYEPGQTVMIDMRRLGGGILRGVVDGDGKISIVPGPDDIKALFGKDDVAEAQERLSVSREQARAELDSLSPTAPTEQYRVREAEIHKRLRSVQQKIRNLVNGGVAESICADIEDIMRYIRGENNG